MTDLNKIYLYRITHIENIPHILKHGVTHKNSPNANSEYINIGDSSLIDARSEKHIIVDNGKQGYGYLESIKLGNFIPFYFGYRMPMLFVIQKGYNGVKIQLPENIVYCVSSVQKIIDEGLGFYFTDGHAIDSLSCCYDSRLIKEVNQIVDFDAAKAPDWTIKRDLKRKKEAEFLINADLHSHCLIGYICYNANAKMSLRRMGVAENMIHVNPKYYF